MMARLNATSFDDPAWTIVMRRSDQLAAREFFAAIASFTAAIGAFTEGTPTAAIAETFICRGAAFGRNGEPESAIADFSRAIELDPRRALAFYNRDIPTNNWPNIAKQLSITAALLSFVRTSSRATCVEACAENGSTILPARAVTSPKYVA